MGLRHSRAVVAGLALLGAAGCGSAVPERRAARAEIHLEDVAAFYALYAATGGRPTAEQLQHEYLDRGSEGLHRLAAARNVTGARIAETLRAHPEVYADAKRCVEPLPRVRRRVEAAMRTLAALYPAARFPPVTIAVGRGRPVAIGSPVTGVQVGLEALCATKFMQPEVEDRFVHVIVHEFAHVQQVAAMVDDVHPTVLQGSLVEGAAELVAELTSGDVSYGHLRGLTAGREREIETAFLADVDSSDLSRWLYNGTPGAPGDLGYWVGYRICKAYYLHAGDKPAALRELLEMTDPKAVLAKSGWRPGMDLR